MKFDFRGVLKDLTWMQVCAGALAAATSFFLSSSIGIAGSLIGAAVGSVVTTFSSTIYKSVFSTSDKVIKQKIGLEDVDADPQAASEETAADVASATNDSPISGDHFADPDTSCMPAGSGDVKAPDANNEPAHDSNTGGTSANSTSPVETSLFLQVAATLDDAGAPAHEGVPGAATPSAAVPTDVPASAYTEAAAVPASITESHNATPLTSPYAQAAQAASATPIAANPPDELVRIRSLVAQRRAKRTERLVVIVSLVTGLIAVGISAAIITGATHGEGIGYRPEPSAQPATVASNTSAPAATDTESLGADASGQTATGPVADASTPATDDAATPTPDTNSGDAAGEGQGDSPAATPDVQPDAGEVPGNGGSTSSGATGEPGSDGTLPGGSETGGATGNTTGDTTTETGGSAPNGVADPAVPTTETSTAAPAA